MVNWTELAAAAEQILSSSFLFRHTDGNDLLANLINEYNYKLIVVLAKIT